MTYGSSWAAGTVSVWVALSDTGGAHADAAASLRAEIDRTLPGRVDWRVAHWSEFRKPGLEPQGVVAVGTAAQAAMQDLFATDPAPPPLLAILVPRLAFERAATAPRTRGASLSAAFLDQSPERQMELIRLALPAVRKVGILVGAESKALSVPLERAARERGMELVVSPVGPGGLFAALQSVLTDAEVLLALPDPAVFNSQTAASILTAAYRRKVPLVGFSPSWAKAGALFSLYSTPAQVGTRGGEMLRQFLSGRPLPPSQWADEFVASVNQEVAHSLGLRLDEAELGDRLRRAGRPW